jgi:hypothetical protein
MTTGREQGRADEEETGSAGNALGVKDHTLPVCTSLLLLSGFAFSFK